jgi:hypothetical protein
MKKYIVVILIAVFVLITVTIYVYSDMYQDMETSSDNRVLIDSIKLDNAENLYWFKLESGIGNSSVSFISIAKNACEVNKDNAIIKGDLIYQVNCYNDDTIVVTSRLNYETLKPFSKYKFVNKDFESGQKILHQNLQKEIPFTQLCK